MIRTVQNLMCGAKMYPLWTRLAIADIHQIYRRSLIGIAWITFSFALFIGVKILIFGSISSVENDLFACWLTIGFWVWTFILANVSDGCNSFITARPWILGTKLPLSVFLYQSLSRSLINFAFTLVVVIGVLVYMKWTFNLIWLWAIPGFFIIVINALWVQIFLATIGTRYRDFIHLTQSIMRVMFFLTPILYMPEQLGENAYLLNYNPFTHFIALIRDPIVLYSFPTLSWVVVLIFTIFGWVSSLILFHFWGRNVPFWV